MTLDVLHHHDRVVDDETDGEHDGEERQQVHGEPGDQHQEHRADERHRNRDDRNEHRSERAEEQEDDNDDDEQRLGQRPEHFVDRILDVLGGVVRNTDLHARRQLRPDLRNRLPHLADHFKGVGRRQHPHAHERGGLAVEPHVLFVVLGAEDDVGDFAEPHDHAVLLLDDQLAEFLGGPQVGVGHEIHRHHRSLRPPERREIVVPRQRVADRRGRDAERRHPVRFQPDPHGERARAENVGALDAADRAQLRLDDARQIVGNLIRIEIVGREAEIDRRELVVGRLEIDDRRLGLRRQIVAHLRDLRLDLRERGIGVVIQLQVDGDRAERLRARRFHVVDAVGAGDHALERRRDEPAHEIRVRSHVHGRHRDHGDVAARVLPYAQRTDGLQAGDQDDQADHHREHRPPDEQVGKLH